MEDAQKGSVTMYGRVVIVNAQQDQREKIARIIRDSVVPQAKQQQGFKGHLALIDPGPGKGIAISLWQTEADMRAGETGDYVREQLTRVAHLLTSALALAGYEVLAPA